MLRVGREWIRCKFDKWLKYAQLEWIIRLQTNGRAIYQRKLNRLYFSNIQDYKAERGATSSINYNFKYINNYIGIGYIFVYMLFFELFK